jgi:glyoxylase-like metal-dependent hydrolase (beta-lactamase superfamily II)
MGDTSFNNNFSFNPAIGFDLSLFPTWNSANPGFDKKYQIYYNNEDAANLTGNAGGEPARLLAAVEASGVELEKILLTHGHIDHAGATAELAERLGLPIEGPQREERFWIDLLPQQAEMFGVGHARSFEPTRWLEGGDTVALGALTLDVRHCPGHTPGHVIFFHPPSRFALVGDVLFQGSIGRTDFPRGDYDTLIRSIQEELLPLGDDVRFLPGHGPMSTFGHERTTNPFLVDPESFRPG